MKSLRLNKEMRENILNNFVAKYLLANPAPEQPLNLQAVQSDIAKKINNKLYGKYTNLVPVELLNQCQYLNVQLPNDSVTYWYYRDEDGDSTYLTSTRERKVEYTFTEQDPLWVEYQAKVVEYKKLTAELEVHTKALNKFKSEVKQVLESVNTTLQLVEVWPEALPFVPQEISNPSSINLPAVNFAELNKVIAE